MSPVARPVVQAAARTRDRFLSSVDRRLLLWVLLAYLLCRILSAALIVWMAPHDGSLVVSYRTGGGPLGYWDVVHSWDGKWYEQIIRDGYPRVLPHRQDGSIDQNTWAFLPLYPALVEGVMVATGASFAVAGSLLSLACGGAAVLLMAVLLRERIGAAGAFAACLVLAAAPSSPVLQMTYTESLGILLLVVFLWAVDRSRWPVAICAALLLGFERPIALPLVGVMVAVLLRMAVRRAALRPRLPEVLGALMALVATGVSGLAWPLVAAHMTGDLTAYTDTQAAWRTGAVVPFKPWVDNFQLLFGDGWGIVILFVLVALVLLMMLGPWARDLGFLLRAWLLSYSVYLLATVDVWTSIYRYLLFLWPLTAIMVGAAHRRSQDRVLVGLRTALITGLFLGWQVWWVWELLRFVPPSDVAP